MEYVPLMIVFMYTENMFNEKDRHNIKQVF